jgi:hypothetical protein
MGTRVALFRTLLALSLALVACDLGSLPFLSERATPGADGTSSLVDNGQASNIDTPEGPPDDDVFLTEAPPPPPPHDLFGAMQEQMEGGIVTRERALIGALQVLAGESTSAELFADRQPDGLEGTGVVLEAKSYLASPEDLSAAAEIEWLLSIVVPDVAQLLEYAQPEGQAASRRGVSRPLGQDACTDLAEQGFPPGSAELCFLYKQSPIGSHTARVFYPASWGQNGPLTPYAEHAMQAVLDSHAALNQYAPFQNVDLIFTLLPSSSEPAKTLAVVESEGGEPRCEILIFPLSLPASDAIFKQTVAHEMVHCLQQWRYPSSFPDNWDVHDWWGESSAEYFSNVVYPAANDEWGRLASFNVNSATQSLVEMSYENWIFLQYLANQQGESAVWGLVDSLNPSASDSLADHTASLAAFPGMEAMFHQFGRDYVDTKILDTSGATVPTGFLQVQPAFRYEIGSTDHTVSFMQTAPFTLTRYGLVFLKEHVYGLSTEQTGQPGTYGSRLVLGPASWNPLPPTIGAGCGDVKIYLLITAATGGAADTFELSLTSDVIEEVGCDQCLVGTWDLNEDSFQEYAEAPFADMGDFYQFIEGTGLWRYHFFGDGAIRGEFDFTYAYQLNQENEPLGNNIVMNGFLFIEGQGQGSYYTDGASNLTFALGDDDVTFEQNLFMNGQPVQEGPLELPGAGASGYLASSAVYSCDDVAGELLINFVPESGLPPILYDRVSKSP